MREKVTILLILLVTLCQAECPIECFCDEVSICSGGKRLTLLPELHVSIPVVRLELHDFLLQHLTSVTFLRLANNISELRLTNNPLLTSLDNDTFNAPERKPDLNRPSGSGGSSGTGEDLEVLNLRTLDLSGNAFKYFVGGGRLKRLRVLDLSSNGLQQVYNLQALTSLESVNLRDNQLAALQETLFQNLRNLQYINLDSNKIVRVDPRTFSNLPSLAHLILSSNPIQNLLPGFFWNSRVQFVDVSRVGLSRIPTSLTTSVRDFRCANNNLTTIRQSDFESYPNVGLLVLDENSIETVEDDAFGRLDFLSRLWINGNRLKRIPQNLPPSLRSLQLEDNRINAINTSDLRNLRHLEELNLHGNQILSIAAGAFSQLGSLRNLDLRSNQLDTLEEKVFENLTGLESLDISQNPLKVIVNGVFQHLTKLSRLHLSRLMEKSLEFDSSSSFHPLVNLEILELDDSPSLAQSIFRDGALSFFLSLIQLNLQRCQLQDLQIVSTSIHESPIFDSLRELRLSGNPWDCSNFSPDTIRDYLQLLSKGTVIDADQMVCSDQRGVKVISAALNFSTSNDSQSPVILTTTTTKPLVNYTNHISTLAPTTYSSNTSVSSFNNSKELPTTSATPSQGSAKGNHTTFSTLAFTNNQAPVTTRGTTETSRLTNDPLISLRPAAGSVKLEISEKPTRSYFEDGSEPPTTASFTGTRQKGKPGPNVEKKLFPPTHTPPQPDANVKEHEGARAHMKTNDDNAIIDEERSPMSSQDQQQQQQMSFLEPKLREGGKKSFRKTVGGSIDGFPALHPHPEDDPVTNQPHSSSHIKNSPQPNPSFLKSYQERMSSTLEEPSSPHIKTTGNSTVILKTLIIIAVACLLSILFLLSLSLIVFRFCSPGSAQSSASSWRRKTRSFPRALGRKKWEKADEDCISVSNNALSSYENLNPGSAHRGPTGMSYTRLGDQDTVELSGITNRLYFENEDIYHIT